MAAIRAAELHMPISLVSISHADSTVTSASHDGCLKHYRYTPPADSQAAGLNALFECSSSAERPLRSSPARQHKSASEQQEENQAWDVSSSALTSDKDPSQNGRDEGNLEADSTGVNLGRPGVSEEGYGSRQAATTHMQRTDHDREQADMSQPAKTAKQLGAEGIFDLQTNQRQVPQQNEQPMRQALGDVSVQAVSALTVIESQLKQGFSAMSGMHEHVLSGFQVSCAHSALMWTLALHE